MRCLFCHNPDTWDAHAPVSYEWTAEELLKETLRYRSYIQSGGVTCTGGEPLLQAPYVAKYFRLCHQEGLHTALDTSGVIWNDDVLEVLKGTDLVLLDIKTVDDALHKKLTGCSRTNNQRMLDYLQEKAIPVWIRHVVTPEINDDEAHLRSVAEYLRVYDVVERVEILPYHTMGVHKYQAMNIPYPLKDIPALSIEKQQQAVDIFSSILSCKVL